MVMAEPVKAPLANQPLSNELTGSISLTETYPMPQVVFPLLCRTQFLLLHI